MRSNLLQLSLITLFVMAPAVTFADVDPNDVQFYRSLTLNVRNQAAFRVPMPSGGDLFYDYKFEFGELIYLEPIVRDTPVRSGDTSYFYRDFWDRIFLKDGSYVNIGGEHLPLTCIFVSAQDNRYSGNNSPLIPKFIMRIYLVANDYTCTGPLNPNWPAGGGKKETWDTYVHFEVRDPTIMLPVEARIRYRWNEFPAILVK